jgi:hypothetical protein
VDDEQPDNMLPRRKAVRIATERRITDTIVILQ